MGFTRLLTLRAPGTDRTHQGAAGEGSLRSNTSKNKRFSGAAPAPDSLGKINLPENFGLAPRYQLLIQARPPCWHAITD